MRTIHWNDFACLWEWTFISDEYDNCFIVSSWLDDKEKKPTKLQIPHNKVPN